MNGDYRTAAQLKAEADASRGLAAGPAASRSDEIAPGPLVVVPEITREQSIGIWNRYLDLKEAILSDPNCYDEIEGKREMNRTGATRLALPFGLSIEQADLSEARTEDAETHEYDYRYLIRVRVSKGDRHVDGIGSCRISEIPATTKTGKPVPIGQREHFALTRAWTRAAKRAIADILGGTEAE